MGMCLHTGATKIDYGTLSTLALPQSIGTKHFPIPHINFYDSVTEVLYGEGFILGESTHAVWGDNAERYFALVRLTHQVFSDSAGWSSVLCLRAAHDQAFARQIGLGNEAFVCDNLQFHNTVMAGHKNTRFAEEELRQRVLECIPFLHDQMLEQQQCIEAQQRTHLSRENADHLLMRMTRERVFSGSTVTKVDQEYMNPHVSEFRKPTPWSLGNAVTYVERDKIIAYPERTMKMNAILNEFCEDEAA